MCYNISVRGGLFIWLKEIKYKITFEGNRTSRKMRVVFTPKLQTDVTTMQGTK